MKKLYHRLTPQQRDKYYTSALSLTSNTHYGITTDWQISGESTASILFETPLSSSTFKKLKDFVTEMNSPNGIDNTKTECRVLIETLLKKKQITQQQADELFRAGKISQD